MSTDVPVSSKSDVNEADQPSYSPAYAWYVVAVFLLIVIFGWIDRQLIALLVEPIKHDLGLQDWQIGVLHGFTFAIFFAIAGLPIGYLADKHNRRNILTAGTAVWSLMTAVCGLATSFMGLFFARVGVAVGEATLRPCADSMIADYFPPNRTSLAYSVYMAGITLGIGLAFILGAAAMHALSSVGPIVWPIVGELKLWQATFILVGLLGLPVAALSLTVKEPARRLKAAGGEVSFRRTMSYLKQNWAIYAAYYLGFTFVATAAQAAHAWGATFLIRTFDFQPVSAGLTWGFMVVVFATAGVFFGGFWARSLSKKEDPAAYWKIALYTQILAIPFGLIAFVMPTPLITILMLCPYFFFQSAISAMQPATLMAVTPNEYRGQITAMFTVGAVIFALTVGPTLAGVLNDFLFPGQIRYSLASISATFPVIAALIFWRSIPIYRAAVARMAG
ncbi:MAG: MFS transporter [Hyphomonadaceae bacterium]|nr:MFS transporter [Hyphomonadaceae bacterium]